MKVTFILGLPGSGKTEFAKSLIDDRTKFIDDYIDEVLDNDFNYVITSADAVFAKKEQIIKKFGCEIDFIAFENDLPACWDNLVRRGDDRISFNHLTKWSECYDPTQYDKRKPVWIP